jgi:hypothetical protein
MRFPIFHLATQRNRGPWAQSSVHRCARGYATVLLPLPTNLEVACWKSRELADGRSFTVMPQGEVWLVRIAEGIMLERPAQFSHLVDASTLPAVDHKIVCDFEEGCTSLESQVPSKTATRPFPLEGKLLGCFCEVCFPLFSSWPSASIVPGTTAVRPEIYRRFTGGFAGNKGWLGHSVRMVRFMQNLKMPVQQGFQRSR